MALEGVTFLLQVCTAPWDSWGAAVWSASRCCWVQQWGTQCFCGGDLCAWGRGCVGGKGPRAVLLHCLHLAGATWAMRRHATTQGDLALLVLSRGNKAEVHGSTAVEKCCIKAGNVQCALQMKRFFICVVKEEKYLQAWLITQESSCGYQGSSALIPSDNSKLNQLLCWGFSVAESYTYNKRNGHCLSYLPFLHLNKFLNCTVLPPETSDLLHFKWQPLLQQYLFLSRFVIRLFLLNCCYSSY